LVKCSEAVNHSYWIIILSGAFGEVRMCVHRDTGAQRAVKVLRKSHMDEDEKKMLFNEINILRELVSPLFSLSALLFNYLYLSEKAYL
jgi:serine/threonine protein kinase